MTAPTQAPPTPAAGKQQQVAPRAFKIGAQEVDDDPYDVSKTLTTAPQTLTPQYEVPSTGFLRNIYVLVENTVVGSTSTVTGTAGVGVLKEDGPYNAIASLTFTDTNNAEIVGPIAGWDLYVISKWGGYAFQDDPEVNPDLFTVTANATASSAAAGSFSFMLRIPSELVPRDALGALPNKSSSTPFKVKIQLSAIADIYNTSITVGGTCRVRMFPDSYWEPTPTDGSGNPVATNPPGVNTTQYWNKTDYTLQSGSATPQFVNSVGFPVRNLFWVLRDSNGSRLQGESDFPDNFKLQLQSNIVLNRPKIYWKKRITEQWGYLGAGDSAGQKDNGLYGHPFCADFYGKPGWETRRSYLRTTDGMRLGGKMTIGGTGVHVLTVYTNYVGVGPGTSLAAITT